jgi:DUF438 domain-containing protein
MTNQPYEGATPEQLRSPMVQHFLEIHNMFRNELRIMLKYVQDLMSGEAQLNNPTTKAQINRLVGAGIQYTHMLHMHHNLETTQMFPGLLQAGLDSEIVDKLNSDHDEIAVLIDKFGDAIQDYSMLEPEVVDNDLRRLSDALTAHLAYEETHVCPILAMQSGWY